MIAASVTLSVTALGGVPLIGPGDDLAETVLAAAAASSVFLETDHIVVLAQKIVSKAEGRMVNLDDVVPSPCALTLASDCGKDPRLVELILSESDEVLRVRPGVLIVRTRHGLVLANAGIDQSNIDHAGGGRALLLPVDPDASAAAVRAKLLESTGLSLAVLVIDSLGRAWRNGTIGTAIGVAGMAGVLDLRGRRDLSGRPLESSELGLADEVAAAASLTMGQAGEGRPIAIVSGVPYPARAGSAAELVRARHLDLFR